MSLILNSIHLDSLILIKYTHHVAPDGENWGGRRAGAGRPPSSTVTARVKVPREVWATLSAEAAQHGRTPEEHAAHVLMLHVTALLFATMQ